MLKKLTTRAIEEKGELKERMAEISGCKLDCQKECGKSPEVQFYAQLSMVY